MASSLTYGEAITRLCQLRDEMKKTSEGRTAIWEVIYGNPDLMAAWDRRCEAARVREEAREREEARKAALEDYNG